MKSLNYSGTGSHENIASYREVVYPFGEFEITVKLGNDNQFVSISEVKIKKEFYSYQSLSSKKSLSNVDEFYKE
jgi:hypothetical protein